MVIEEYNITGVGQQELKTIKMLGLKGWQGRALLNKA